MSSESLCGGEHSHAQFDIAPDEDMIASMESQDVCTPPPEPHSLRQYATATSFMSQHNQPRIEKFGHPHASSSSSSSDSAATAEPSVMPVLLKHADQAIAPFYAQHVPSQYNPVGEARDGEHQSEYTQGGANTKYCNRHRPDLKCRRQVDEPSMDDLQAVSPFPRGLPNYPELIFQELSDMTLSDQQAITQIWSIFSAAPAKHRNMILRGLLTQCCFPQLSFLSNQVRDLLKIDFISALPAELSYKILCSLDTTSLCNAARVSRKWRQLADDDFVWHRMCEQHIDRKCTKCGWGLPLLDKRRLRLEKTILELRAKGVTLPPGALNATGSDAPADVARSGTAAESGNTPVFILPHHDELDELDLASRKRSRPDARPCAPRCKRPKPGQRPWKDVYRDRFKVGTNWKYGRCSIRTFKGHSNGVMCLQFDDTILATGSYDATIRLWNIESGELIRTLKGHTSGVRCLQFDSSTLMSGSLDGTMRVWNWRTGVCSKTLNAHRGGVITLHFTSKIIATGSTDRTIKVFDMRHQPNPTNYRLRGHADWVNSVKIDQDSATLFSCSDDFTVRLWDLETRRCIRCFEGHVGQVQQVLPMPREFEPYGDGEHGSGDGEQVSSGANSPVAQHTTYGTPYPSDNGPYDQSGIPQFWKETAERKAPPRYMITGALDSTIRLWDVYADCKMVRIPSAPVDANDTSGHGTTPYMPTVFHHMRTFFGHVEGIWSLAVDHLRLVSGSEDRMVKVWDPRTGKCERTWTGHAGPVTCVGISDSRLVSGSEDCEVRMLEFGVDEDRDKLAAAAKALIEKTVGE